MKTRTILIWVNSVFAVGNVGAYLLLGQSFWNLGIGLGNFLCVWHLMSFAEEG